LQAQAKQQSAAQGQQAGKLQGPQLKQMKKQAIDALVGNELVLQDADKRGIEPTPSEVKKRVDETKKHYQSKKKLHDALKSSHLTMKQFKKRTADQIQVQKYQKKVVGPVKVSDQQVKQYYKQSMAQQGQQGKTPPLKQVKPQIKKQLKQQKQQQQMAKVI